MAAGAGAPVRPDALERPDERRRGILDRWVKRVLPRSLLARSVLILLMPVLLIQAIGMGYFYQAHWDELTKRLSNGVVGEIAMMADLLTVAESQDHRDWLFIKANENMHIHMAYLEGGTLQPSTRPRGFERFWHYRVAHALDERIGRPFAIRSPVAEDWTIIAVQLDDGVLEAMVQRKRLFSHTSQVILLYFLAPAIVFFTVAMVFMRNQIRPIRRLAEAAEGFGKGRDTPTFRLEGATEVRQAGRAFLIMRDRIRRQISQRTEMLAGVSHDLRTPLTRMKLQLAMLGDSPDAAELCADVDDMERMIEGYLAFARGEGEEPADLVDVTALLDEVATAARRAGADVVLRDVGPVSMVARADALKRCLGNLVSNAARYGTGRVWIGAEATETHLSIIVDDDGPGIPEPMFEEAFKPFFRLDPSRNTATGGTGLGLTIARDIARTHGGDVALGHSPRGGLRCTVRLPR